MKLNLAKTAGAVLLGLACVASAGAASAANRLAAATSQHASDGALVRSMLDFPSAE